VTSVYYSSPIGPLKVQAFGSQIVSIKFVEGAVNMFSPPEPGSILYECYDQLDEYFNGTRKEFSFSFNQEGTEFQKQVWAQLLTIPYGKTVSYAELSIQMGNIKKIRAVGASNGRNNLAIIVPCHRVIGSNQQLTGYAGGLWRKRWLLDHEAKFSPGARQLKLI
jgi:methylated-DNA-[protein]-cysteine S-methyltransferase